MVRVASSEGLPSHAGQLGQAGQEVEAQRVSLACPPWSVRRWQMF